MMNRETCEGQTWGTQNVSFRHSSVGKGRGKDRVGTLGGGGERMEEVRQWDDGSRDGDPHWVGCHNKTVVHHTITRGLVLCLCFMILTHNRSLVVTTIDTSVRKVG